MPAPAPRLVRYRRLAAFIGLLAPGIAVARCFLDEGGGALLSENVGLGLTILAYHLPPVFVLEVAGLTLRRDPASMAVLLAGGVVVALRCWVEYSSPIDPHGMAWLHFVELPAIAMAALVLAASVAGSAPTRDPQSSSYDGAADAPPPST